MRIRYTSPKVPLEQLSCQTCFCRIYYHIRVWCCWVFRIHSVEELTIPLLSQQWFYVKKNFFDQSLGGFLGCGIESREGPITPFLEFVFMCFDCLLVVLIVFFLSNNIIFEIILCLEHRECIDFIFSYSCFFESYIIFNESDQFSLPPTYILISERWQQIPLYAKICLITVTPCTEYTAQLLKFPSSDFSIFYVFIEYVTTNITNNFKYWTLRHRTQRHYIIITMVLPSKKIFLFITQLRVWISRLGHRKQDVLTFTFTFRHQVTKESERSTFTFTF